MHKYNEKLMNSIWNLYNMNAPHAFQKNAEVGLRAPQVATGVTGYSSKTSKSSEFSFVKEKHAQTFNPNLFTALRWVSSDITDAILAQYTRVIVIPPINN